MEIDCTDGKGAATHRRVWPLSVDYTDFEPLLLAWCCLRRDFRRFRISRISSVSPHGESFRPRRVPLLRDMLAQLQGRGS